MRHRVPFCLSDITAAPPPEPDSPRAARQLADPVCLPAQTASEAQTTVHAGCDDLAAK